MKWLGWAGLVVALLVLGGQLGVEAGLRHRIAEREDAIDSLGAAAAELRTALRLALPLVDSLVDTLWLPTRARVESLPVDRPVPYPVYVETVRAADTTINACRRTLHDCATLAATDSVLIDTLHAQVADLVKALRGPPLRFLGYGASDLRGHLFVGAEGTWRPPLLPVTAYGRVESRVDSVALGLRVGVAMFF